MENIEAVLSLAAQKGTRRCVLPVSRYRIKQAQARRSYRRHVKPRHIEDRQVTTSSGMPQRLLTTAPPSSQPPACLHMHAWRCNVQQCRW